MNCPAPFLRLLNRLARLAPPVFIGTILQLRAATDISGNGASEKENSLPLPRWSEQELRAFRENLPLPHQSGVLPPEKRGDTTDIHELLRAPLSSGPRLEGLFQDPGLPPRLRTEDMRLFLPESILVQPASDQETGGSHVPTPLSSLLEVTPEFMTACERAMTKEYLVDPDMLEPEMQSHDLRHFLEFHARDASIKLYVLIMPHDRKLPAKVDFAKIASGGLMQTQACLLVYPLGEPWRARLFMSSSLHDHTSPQFLTETVGACLQEAMHASDTHDQLHRYAVHLSTRLFWLQRALGSSAGTNKERSLAEFMPEGVTAAPSGPGWAFILMASFGSMVSLMVVAMAGHQIYLRRRVRRQKRSWLLPELETVPRLGGAFTGGGGGSVRYGQV